jgi:hypothetical protein
MATTGRMWSSPPSVAFATPPRTHGGSSSPTTDSVSALPGPQECTRSANSGAGRFFWPGLLVGALFVTPGAVPAAPSMRVLFIGNSLTLSNGLPAMVEQLARMAGGPDMAATVVATAGYSLEDHWSAGEARRALGSGTWNAVVLQQGPSSRSDSRVVLREYVARFHGEAQARRARVALYMVWPPRAGPGTFDQVGQSYALAARDVGGLLLPVGLAVRAALALEPRQPLLGPDGFHPTPLGTVLAAVVIHQHLTGRAAPLVPDRLPVTASSPAVQLDPATREILRAAAIAAAREAK